jgi:hypothetical protein
MLRACRSFKLSEKLAPPGGEPRTFARCRRLQVDALYKFPNIRHPGYSGSREKKFESFLERAMLRPLADDFRPNKNGFL